MNGAPYPGIPGVIPLGDASTGLFLEVGVTSFTANDTEASIQTNLDEIIIAMAQVYDTYSVGLATDGACDVIITIDKAVSSGACVAYRNTSAAAANATLPFSYILIGRMYETA